MKKKLVLVRGNPDVKRTGYLDKTGNWIIYRYDPKKDAGNWSVGHVMSGMMVSNGLDRAKAERLAERLGDEVLETFIGRPERPSKEFQMQVIEAIAGIDRQLVPKQLRKKLKGEGKGKKS